MTAYVSDAWTQKGPTRGGTGSLHRANIEIPKGESPTNRSDIEVLFEHLPEPIDLEVDLENRVLYWTDRGDPPRGNTVNRVPIKEAEPASPSISRPTGCSSPISPAQSMAPISMERTSAPCSALRAT